MLTFIGIGPGDPELLTLKAVRLLREADAIALPDKGVALRIVGEWIQEKPLLKLDLPMRGNRAEWEQSHERAAQALLAHLNEYGRVAFPVLGDPGVYATSSYLFRRIQPLHPCEIVPGIPAMCAAAAKLGVPLCEQGESLTVLDRLDGELPRGNAVVMKSGKRMEELRSAARDREAYVARNLGMDDEWCGRLADAPEMDSFYFTTTIVRPCK